LIAVIRIFFEFLWFTASSPLFTDIIFPSCNTAGKIIEIKYENQVFSSQPYMGCIILVEKTGMQLTDTHCHLDFERFNPDRDQVVQRALKAGVQRILVPGIDLHSSMAAVGLTAQVSQIYAAVGVHPNSGTTWTRTTLAELTELFQNNKVVAVGEIGLDYYRDATPQHLQRKIFREQLEMAAEQNLPVVIHNRQASQDLIPILQEWQEDLLDSGSSLADRPGVLHSFSDDYKTAEQVLELGFYLGFTGPVTFRKAVELQDIARRVPFEKLLIETDAPYLTPHPFRGKRNEPAHVQFVAEKIAELRGLLPDEVGKISTANAKKLFNW
jgi:TatD DNase family protein